MKFFSAIGTFFTKVFDFFLDKSNNGDEKRFWGNVLIAWGLVYASTHEPTWFTIVMTFGLILLGGTLLGVAAFADRIPNLSNIGGSSQS